jgi:hypothetical protein
MKMIIPWFVEGIYCRRLAVLLASHGLHHDLPENDVPVGSDEVEPSYGCSKKDKCGKSKSGWNQ